MRLEVRGLEPIVARFRGSPERLRQVFRVTAEASLLKLQENVPPYPPEPPQSTYDRTGTLGRTLGASQTGDRIDAKPDIYEVRQFSGYIEGAFGTNLDYAPFVIGDDEQAWMHRGRWWQMKDIAERAKADIERLWQVAVEELAAWLDGK